VAPTNHVNVALPFSKLSVQEASAELRELAAVVAQLAELVETLSGSEASRSARVRADTLLTRLQ
jgi:hypothetical protein